MTRRLHFPRPGSAEGHRSLIGVLAFLSLVACGSDDSSGESTPKPDPKPQPETPTLLERATTAIGGKDALTGIENERVEATGQRFDDAEANSVGELLHVSDFHYTSTADTNSARLRVDMENTTKFLIPTPYKYAEMIDEDEGWADGHDDLWQMLTGGPAQEAMPSSRIRAHLRHSDLTSPVRLLRHALANPDAVTEEADSVLALAEEGQQTIRIYLDPSTHLPIKAETLEDHPPVGDTTIAYLYDDYRDVGGVKFPHRVTVNNGELAIHTEERTSIATNVDVAEDAYVVPASFQQPFDEALGAYGERATQVLLGWQFLGFEGFFLDQSAVPPMFVELAPHVQQIVGVTHHSLLIEMSDHLVLVDAPLYDGLSENVLAAIKEKYPDKPVREIIATHFHHDHCGGIRRYAAEGGVTVYSGSKSVPFFESVFESKHTVSPDAFEGKPMDASVEGIDTSKTLTDGTMSVEMHHIKTTHANDMLVVYLPAQKILFNADLFTPLPMAAGMPAPGDYGIAAGELYDAVKLLGLDVQAIAGAHGYGTGTLEDLRAAGSK